MKKGDAKRGGFTIIEVTLVLAIAGLIFLMVFIALPSLQRNQRDAQRREAMMTFLEQLKKFQTNNRGALPGATLAEWESKFFNKYFDDSFIDPSGGEYDLGLEPCGDVNTDAECTGKKVSEIYTSAFPYGNYELVVVTQATCKGDKTYKTSNPRNVAVLYRLEGAGVYCGNT